MAAPKTPPTTVPPKDAPNELVQQFASALAQFQQPQDDSDPPVWSSGYWDYDESTGKQYFVNYLNQKPLSKAILDFYSLSPDELRRFQELAFQAGLYGTTAERGDIPFGAKDSDTFQLWQQLNKQAAGYAQVGKNNTIWDVLQDLVNNRPENSGKQNKKRGPLVKELPDPREIEELIPSAAVAVLGQNASPEFTQDFIAMYTKIVEQYQENKYALQGTEEGGTITAPPSAESLARFRLRTENPEQAQEFQSAQRQSQYVQLLKGLL